MSFDTTQPNTTKETGGNADAQTALLTKIEQLVQLVQRDLAVQQAILLQLAHISGVDIQPSTLTDDTTHF